MDRWGDGHSMGPVTTGRPSPSQGRPRPLLAWAGWCASAAVLLGLTALWGWLARSGWVVGTDRHLDQLVLGLRGDVATTVFRWVTVLGDPRVVLAATGIVVIALAWHHRYAPALLVATSTLGALGLTVAAKWIVARERPEHGALVGTLGSALPSGHSALALAFLGAMATVAGERLASRHRRVALWALVAAATGAVGFSRLYLGTHWPSDVAIGLVIGAWWLGTCTVTVNSVLRDPGERPARMLRAARERAREPET